MRGAVLLFILAIATMASSAKIDSFLTMTEMEQFEKIRKDPWGEIVFELAELHTETGGILQDLVIAVKTLLHDLERQKKQSDKSYDQQANKHDKEVQRLRSNIQAAQTDIINTSTKIKQVLIPLKNQLEKTIQSLRGNINFNKRTQARLTEERKAQNREYLKLLAEHQAAIKELDQAIRVVNGLKKVSLIELQPLHHSLARIHKILLQTPHAPMVQAMISLTGRRDVDMEAVRGCLKLLNHLRQLIIDDLNKATQIENFQKKVYLQRMSDLADELTMFQNQLARAISDLSTTNKRISAAKIFLAQRTANLAEYRKLLKAENDNFAKITGLYKTFSKEIAAEIGGARACFTFLTNVNFRGYLNSRINAAGIKSTGIPNHAKVIGGKKKSGKRL